MVCVMTEQKKMIQQDWGSRKYRVAWKLTFIFLGLLVLPKIFSLLVTLFVGTLVFEIIPVEYVVTFLSLIWGAYFTANVTEKYKSFVPKSDRTFAEDRGDGFGGQPEEADNP